MAIKATVYKATVQIADMDRGLYATHTLTLARQPSETDERLMVRLLAFALQCPADDGDGALMPAAGVADADEPDLWRRSLGGELLQWVEVGQPEAKRLVRACGRARRVAVYAYSGAARIWWTGVAGQLARLRTLEAWLLPAAQTQALAALAARTMQLQVTVQEGTVWVGDGVAASIEIQPEPLQVPDGR